MNGPKRKEIGGTIMQMPMNNFEKIGVLAFKNGVGLLRNELMKVILKETTPLEEKKLSFREINEISEKLLR